MNTELKFWTVLAFLVAFNSFLCFGVSYLLSLVVSVHPGHIMIIIFCAAVIYKMWYKDGY